MNETPGFINFDANASYGLLPEVWEECARIAGTYGNPSSVHQIGQSGRSLIEQARTEVHALVGSPADTRIVFTSGATEANGMLVHLALSSKSGEVLTSEVEHPAILESASYFTKVFDSSLSLVTVRDLDCIPDRVTTDTSLVSLMRANNESGELYPVAKIFAAVKSISPTTICHTDAVQCPGRIPLDFQELSCDALTISGHKIGALMGVGALIINDSLEPVSLIQGGPQESRWRAGTENVLGIYSLGVAARLARNERERRSKRLSTVRDLLSNALKREIEGCEILFERFERLPNTLSVRFPGVSADDLVVALDLESVCISAGSACASGKPLASHVLLGYGLSDNEAREVVRISVSHTLSDTEIERGLQSLISCVRRMKKPMENIA